MKVITFTPRITYSCLQCQEEFESRVFLNFIRFCSNSCKFLFAYSVVSSAFPKASKEAQYSLTRKIVEVCL